MKRRDFLRTLLCGSTALAGLCLDRHLRLGIGTASAGPPNNTLIVLFQRGGNDGLNTLVPFGEAEYYNLRPNIAIREPTIGDPDSAIDLDGFFGLHPALQPLASEYFQGRMAIFPAAHYDNASLSHFNSQDVIESGAAADGPDGWANRYLQTLDQRTSFSGVGFAKGLPHSLAGDAPVLMLRDIEGFNVGVSVEEEARLLQRLDTVYSQSPDLLRPYNELLYKRGRTALDAYDSLIGLDVAGYAPSNGAIYPDTTLGKYLKQTAHLIKDIGGVNIVAVDAMGAWDTHKFQGGAQGSHARQLGDYADSLSALVTDLGALMSNVVILTMTEFGRTARENASLGTDHGNAACWFALGDSVNGGIYNGTAGWPGLNEENLHAGRYLSHTVDYRDILAELLVGHLGNSNLSLTLPGHTATPLGMLA